MTRTWFFILISLTAAPAHADDSRGIAKRLLRMITGVPARENDPRLDAMAAKVSSGDLTGAAYLGTEDDNFYDVTLTQFASHLSTREEFQRTPLNDFTATFVGAAVDNLDARQLLSGDFWYQGKNVAGLPAGDGNSNAHYQFLEASRAPLKTHLQRVSPQRSGIVGAGLLTTWTYLKAHVFRGTNRRPTEFAIRDFLCRSVQDIADLNTPRDRIRQDVERSPGGSPIVFNNKCAGCHGLLDGLAGAFAKWNFEFTDQMVRVNGNVEYTPGSIQPKMIQNAANYPAGYVTTDDSFVNYANLNANSAFGWRGPQEGSGVAALGSMIAASKQFPRCMAERAFSQLCVNVDYTVDRLTRTQKEQLLAAQNLIQGLADDFEASGYQLRRLFAMTATMPKCLNR